jgi:hypothetical protein
MRLDKLILESGENANGNYVKFANGFMIQFTMVNNTSSNQVDNYPIRSITGITISGCTRYNYFSNLTSDGGVDFVTNVTDASSGSTYAGGTDVYISYIGWWDDF